MTTQSEFPRKRHVEINCTQYLLINTKIVYFVVASTICVLCSFTFAKCSKVLFHISV